jgi:hypothetical protein
MNLSGTTPDEELVLHRNRNGHCLGKVQSLCRSISNGSFNRVDKTTGFLRQGSSRKTERTCRTRNLLLARGDIRIAGKSRPLEQRREGNTRNHRRTRFL